MRIYTKTGDAGETGLFDGTRVSKADPRVAAYGDVDELNAHLGVVRANDPGIVLDGMLDRIQRDLFALGARLADPRHKIAARVEKASVDDQDVARLEGWIDDLEAGVKPLRKFILAGVLQPAPNCIWRAPSAGAPSAASSGSAPTPSSRSSSRI